MYEKLLSYHFILRDGKNNFSDFVIKFEKCDKQLSKVWAGLNSTEPLQNILQILCAAVIEIDRNDLISRLIPLRIHGPSTGIFCKLLRVFLNVYQITIFKSR